MPRVSGAVEPSGVVDANDGARLQPETTRIEETSDHRPDHKSRNGARVSIARSDAVARPMLRTRWACLTR